MLPVIGSDQFGEHHHYRKLVLTQYGKHFFVADCLQFILLFTRFNGPRQAGKGFASGLQPYIKCPEPGPGEG